MYLFIRRAFVEGRVLYTSSHKIAPLFLYSLHDDVLMSWTWHTRLRGETQSYALFSHKQSEFKALSDITMKATRKSWRGIFCRQR